MSNVDSKRRRSAQGCVAIGAAFTLGVPFIWACAASSNEVVDAADSSRLPNSGDASSDDATRQVDADVSDARADANVPDDLDSGDAGDPGDGDASDGAVQDSFVQLAAGGGFTCARRSSGTVYCWGQNTYGQLGDGTIVDRLTAAPVTGLTDAVEISAGTAGVGDQSHVCARRVSGAVVCWGANFAGQLGDGTWDNRATPQAVVGVTDAAEIVAGDQHTCARQGTGAVLCWGQNDLGQLGDGTTTTRSTPMAVSGLTDIVQVSAGALWTCARQGSGAVFCWGRNTQGQIGDGTTAARSTPTRVSGLDDAVEIASMGGHSCARRAAGPVVCWGMNTFGRLGDGTTTNSLTPVVVKDLADAVALPRAASAGHTCAIRPSGAVSCWGHNHSGQLGNGSESTSNLPSTPTSTVTGLTGAVEVAIGIGQSCARQASGAIYCWGNNANGEVGDGTTTKAFAATRVTVLP